MAHMTDHADPERRRRTQRPLVLFVLLLNLTILPIVWYIYLGPDLSLIWDRDRFVTVDATVSDLRWSTGKGYRPRLTYEYRYEGQTFRGTRLGLTHRAIACDGAQAHAISAWVRTHGNTARLDPTDPGRSYLVIPGEYENMGWPAFTLVLPALIQLACGGLLVFALIRGRRYRSASETEREAAPHSGQMASGPSPPRS